MGWPVPMVSSYHRRVREFILSFWGHHISTRQARATAHPIGSWGRKLTIGGRVTGCGRQTLWSHRGESRGRGSSQGPGAPHPHGPVSQQHCNPQLGLSRDSACAVIRSGDLPEPYLCARSRSGSCASWSFWCQLSSSPMVDPLIFRCWVNPGQ